MGGWLAEHWRPLRRWLSVGLLVGLITYLDFVGAGYALLERIHNLVPVGGLISWLLSISIRSVFRFLIGCVALVGTLEVVEGDLIGGPGRRPACSRQVRARLHENPMLAAAVVVGIMLCWYLAIFPPKGDHLMLAAWKAMCVALAGLLLCASLFESHGWKYVPLSAACLALSGSKSWKVLLFVDGLAMLAHSFNYYRHLYFLYAAKKDFHERVVKTLHSDSFHPVFVQESFQSMMTRSVRSASIRRFSSFVFKRAFSGVHDSDLLNDKSDTLGDALHRLQQGSQPKLPELQLVVKRSELISSSFRALEESPLLDLFCAEHVRVRFEDEDALDYNGVLRDWFESLGNKLTDEASKSEPTLLTLQESDGTLLLRHGTARWDDFYALGRLLALAVCRGARIPVHFSRATWKMLLGDPIEANDVRAIDPVFFKNRIRAVLHDNGVQAMADILGEPLTFMSATTPSCPEPVPLMPGGEGTRVTEDNKLDYVQKLCEFYMCGHGQKEWKLLIQGFEDLLPRQLLRDSKITHTDLELMICGLPVIDVADWREHYHVDGPFKETPEGQKLVTWFWECVGQFGNERRARLLQFATGSSRMPPDGFVGIKPQFCLYLGVGMADQLPTSNTCNNQLNLVMYDSRRALIDKLTTACHEAHEGFGFL